MQVPACCESLPNYHSLDLGCMLLFFGSLSWPWRLGQVNHHMSLEYFLFPALLIVIYLCTYLLELCLFHQNFWRARNLSVLLIVFCFSTWQSAEHVVGTQEIFEILNGLNSQKYIGRSGAIPYTNVKFGEQFANTQGWNRIFTQGHQRPITESQLWDRKTVPSTKSEGWYSAINRRKVSIGNKMDSQEGLDQ